MTEVDFDLFRYYPKLGAAVLFAILFTAASALHTYQYLVTRTWFFTAFIIGCWCKSALAARCRFSFGITDSRKVEVVGFIAVGIHIPPRMSPNAHHEAAMFCRATKSQLEHISLRHTHHIRLNRSLRLRSQYLHVLGQDYSNNRWRKAFAYSSEILN